MVGIIGRSGAGKSTLLRMVNRLIDPTEGTMLFDGRDVTAAARPRAARLARHAAMIFQQFNLVPRLDVLTNVLPGAARPRSDLASAAAAVPAQRARAGDRRTGAPRHRRHRAAARRHAVGRPAAAGRDRPGADAGAEDHAGRRAGRLARPANAQLVMDALDDINRARRHHRDLQPAHARHRPHLFDRIVGMAHGRIVCRLHSTVMLSRRLSRSA